ncbi:MAG TPA: hypothetical protein VNI54_17790 [Thermoanaerobaculia bacterium]|nr:hypothetical protein [Thermoanaerobaculia bacterium]
MPFLLLLAPALFAQDALVHVVPFGPVANEPMQLHLLIGCEPRTYTVARTGNVFKVVLLDPSCVAVLPIPQLFTIDLPGVEAGEYRAEVFYEPHDSVYASTRFIVRDVPPRDFDMHPSAVPAFGGDLRVRIANVVIPSSTGELRVEVGGQPATNVTRDPNGVISFEPSALPVGLHRVVVRRGTAVVEGTHLYFYDRPERSVFERILFPVLFIADGANGSRWVSEAVISNPRPWDVETPNTLSPVRPCLVYPCGERLYAGTIERYGDGFPRGAVLHVPRNEAPQLSFALRVRDVSRQAEGFGTQVPVVRERDFTHGGDVALLDVPLDPRYRVKLRMYALDPLFGPGTGGQIVARNTVTKAVTVNRHFTLQRVGEDQHHYAELDLPSGGANERVNVYIKFPLDAVAWAFATVTNNETQQVTTVTPQGSGAEPCTTCTVP